MREAFNEFVNDHPDGKIKRKDFGKMMKKVVWWTTEGTWTRENKISACLLYIDLYLDSSREGGKGKYGRSYF